MVNQLQPGQQTKSERKKIIIDQKNHILHMIKQKQKKNQTIQKVKENKKEVFINIM